MAWDIGKAIKRATTVSSEMKKGWGSKGKTKTKTKPKRSPKSRRNNPEMYPPTKNKKTNKVIKDMGFKPLGYWAKEFERFID